MEPDDITKKEDAMPVTEPVGNNDNDSNDNIQEQNPETEALKEKTQKELEDLLN